MYFSKLTPEHFKQVSVLLDSAVLMVEAINESGINGYDLIADDYQQEVEQYRTLIQAFHEPYANSLEAICNGIKKRIAMQHDAIMQQLGSRRFSAVEVAEYLKDFAECKAIVSQWPEKIKSAGSSLALKTIHVESSFLALEQTYHARLVNQDDAPIC